MRLFNACSRSALCLSLDPEDAAMELAVKLFSPNQPFFLCSEDLCVSAAIVYHAGFQVVNSRIQAWRHTNPLHG